MIYKLLSLIEMVKRWDKFIFYEVTFGLKGYNFYYFSLKKKIKVYILLNRFPNHCYFNLKSLRIFCFILHNN